MGILCTKKTQNGAVVSRTTGNLKKKNLVFPLAETRLPLIFGSVRCFFTMSLSALVCLAALSAFIGLAERLSGLFTGNMASRSVGELQEMEGEFAS